MVETRENAYMLEGVSFGLVDGLVCLLGMTMGVAEATRSPTLVIITGIVGGIANAFGNSIGFFISQSTERGVQIHEAKEHGVRTRIHSQMEVLMSGALSFFATVLPLMILLIPYLLLSVENAIVLTFLLGTALTFVLGTYVGKLSGEGPYRTGLKYAALAVAGAVISYLIGDALNHLFKIC